VTEILERVRDYLQSEVIPSGAEHWLTLLIAHDEGKRFAACLAIDLRCEALKPEEVRPFFAAVSNGCADGLEALKCFADAIEAVRDEWVCRSSYKGTPLKGGDRYARVMEIKGFTERYLAPTLPIPPNAAGVREARRMLKRGLPLGMLRSVWRGGLPNVWILSRGDLEKIRAGSHPDHPGTVVNDALGLGFPDGGADDGRPELLAVFYPEGLPDETFQPTTFDCRWDQYLHLFVAMGKNNSWGETFSVSGDPPYCPERVHRAITGLNSSFVAEYIGVSNILTRDVSKLVKTALERFKKTGN
jgi:hypothetical protein